MSHGRGSLVIVTANLSSAILPNLFIVRYLWVIITVKHHLIIFFNSSIISQVTQMCLSLTWWRLWYLWQFLWAFPINRTCISHLTHECSILMSVDHLPLLEVDVSTLMLLLKLLFEICKIVWSFLLIMWLFLPNSYLRLWTITSFSLQIDWLLHRTFRLRVRQALIWRQLWIIHHLLSLSLSSVPIGRMMLRFGFILHDLFRGIL